MLVLGMKKKHKFSPSNLPGKLSTSTISDFLTELHLCVGDAFCEETSRSFVWVVPDFTKSAQGGLQPGRRSQNLPNFPPLFWMLIERKKTPFSGDLFLMKFKKNKGSAAQPLFWLGVVGRFHASRGVFERGWWGLTECSPKLKGGWQGVSGPVFFYEKPMNYHLFEKPPTKSGSYTLGYIPQ